MEIVRVFTALKLAIKYFFNLILTDSESHSNVSAPTVGALGGAPRPLAKSRNAAMALLLALEVQWRPRWQIELSLFINKLSNRLIDGSGCRRIAHLAWIGKMRSADRNL